MKAGRPTYRHKAHWVSYDLGDGTEAFFELDEKGNIFKKGGIIQPPTIKPKGASVAAPRAIQKDPLPLPVPPQPPANQEPSKELFTFSTAEMDNFFSDLQMYQSEGADDTFNIYQTEF